MKKDRSNNRDRWMITFADPKGGRHHVYMPGGLNEAEAVRGAALKADRYWWQVRPAERASNTVDRQAARCGVVDSAPALDIPF